MIKKFCELNQGIIIKKEIGKQLHFVGAKSRWLLWSNVNCMMYLTKRLIDITKNFYFPPTDFSQKFFL